MVTIMHARIPILRERKVDLHRLFVEVTARGGYEKTVSEQRWNKVTAIFNCPTATNVSLELRNCYTSLLLQYEQVYFPKAPDLTPNPSITHNRSQEIVRSSIEIQAERPTSTAGSLANEIIHGKFNSGYFVTVTIGSEKLQGVLYQATESAASRAPQENGTFASKSDLVQQRRHRKQSAIKRDPLQQKRNRSGYNFFFAEQCDSLKAFHRGKSRDLMKLIGEMWKNLNESEEAVFKEKALKDKEIHGHELKDYKENLRIVPPQLGLAKAEVPRDKFMAKLLEWRKRRAKAPSYQLELGFCFSNVKWNSDFTMLNFSHCSGNEIEMRAAPLAVEQMQLV
ncbi:HMG (high mobility group) box with ARID/BRIGHT DNA-binding domain-like protein [Theobroma cacao]|uniref:HMG (High mobility group) box with ARID/BRIGHT DNA-binding domain-like protein n=1 Tax=Theobroma cacao TaxID=3641 RepID=A0A061EJS6_THECC|nr:HMG (high mobility group) box with ARID/BRIGHT DNA-binding domain-like protein [Theobroma cacao]